MTSIQQALNAQRELAKIASPHGAEVDRICQMPIVMPLTRAELDAFQADNVQVTAYENGFRLFDTQCDAVSMWDIYGRGFMPIGVGWGKTLITLMIAARAYSNRQHKKILLLVPPQVLTQLTRHDIPWARTKVALNISIYVINGSMGRLRRRAISSSKRSGLYIMPYSCLSTQDSVDLLEAIAPTLIICDEVHYLARRRTARTRRLMAYVEEHHPVGVALSGTITSKSIRDYYHLIRWCQGSYNPLPNNRAMAEDWAVYLDSGASMDLLPPDGTGPLVPLIEWAQRHFIDHHSVLTRTISGFRKAYQARLTSAPGIVTTGEAEIGTSLHIRNVPVQIGETEGHKDLKRYIDKVVEEWETPNGDEIEHAIHTYKWLYELSAGFYNQLIWPEPDEFAIRRGISEDDAKDILVRAQEHHALGQIYARELREWLKSAPPGMDTPLAVGVEMSNHGAAHVGPRLYETWMHWKNADFDGRPDRDSIAVRVCPFKIRAAREWIRSNVPKGSGCLVWVYHREIGEWAAEIFRNAGFDTLHCPAGETANTEILDPDNGAKIVVASISAHSTGKNLQHFQHQYVLQWPRPANVAEQMLGRTHRQGQRADELIVVTNNSSTFDHANFAATLNDALYISQSTGLRQKLIYASYDPMPRVFPVQILREQGMQPKLLTPEQQRLLQDRFLDTPGKVS